MSASLLLFTDAGLRSRSLLRGAAGVAALPPFHFFPSSTGTGTSPITSTAPPSELDVSASPAWSPGASHASSGFSPISSPRSGFTSPSLSPGPNIRRLAEQFLNSLPDDSPAAGSRSLGGRQPSSRAQRSPAQLPGKGETEAREGVEDADGDEVVDMRVTEDATDDASAWQQLHEECLTFSRLCTSDANAQRKLRDDLVARTRWSIRAVWPQAEVDLVGSVAAGVALPKSDLDFVIWFDRSREPPKSYSYTTAPSPPDLPELPFAVVDAAESAPGGDSDKEVTRSPLTTYTTVATASPLSTTSTLSITSSSSSFSSSSSSSSSSSALTSPSSSASSLTSSPVLQYFAHAGSLIKLIGGRKKSKLLFRSTKIQVFKDINLIRLRDGCSGISMDLWFPADVAILSRSQEHTRLLRAFAKDWRWFAVLAFVIKTFMQQHLLNSGYSGLGSYGVLLMIVRFLQADRERRRAEGEDDEDANVGRVLCAFFHFWAQFDYVSLGVDVRGDGQFIGKPALELSVKRGRVEGGDDDEPRGEEEGAGEEPQDEDDGGDDAQQRRRKKRVATPGDRLSLIIVDPCDSDNFIVCHHKALRNMVQAFIQACAVLDPLSPLPPPAREVQAIALFTEAELRPPPSATSTSSSSTASSVSASLVGSTASTAPATPTRSASTSADPTPAATPRTSPTLPALAALSTPPPVLPTAPSKSRFHRLIDIHHARLGPSMKLCPSPTCLNPDGSSTMCPVQNKVCYTCGHVFLKNGTAGGSAPGAAQSAGKGQQRDNGAREEAKAVGKRSRGHKGHRLHAGNGMGYRPMQPPQSAMRAPAAPLNEVMAGGLIANTNGMKFVSPPPLSPTVPSISPAAAAGGFVYVNTPSPTGPMPAPAIPPSGFNLSMAVSPYYPAHPSQGGGGFYGGGGYDGYGGGGSYGGYQGGGGKRGGRHRGYPSAMPPNAALGMAAAPGFSAGAPAFYPEPSMAYLPPAQFYAPPPAQYYGGSMMGSERY